ncbi:hypothetical protein SPD48_12140 [Pseudogracilibacillus sp. SE30717A]
MKTTLKDFILDKNIASKRKFSISMETVGGQIDVATITKGDGFMWGKKK